MAPKLLPENQDTGFPECPEQLQRFVLSYLAVWMTEPQKVGAIWSNPQNAQLLLEVFSHALSVKTSASDVSISALQTFHRLFFSSSPPLPELQPRLTAYRLYFLK